MEGDYLNLMDIAANGNGVRMLARRFCKAMHTHEKETRLVE